MTISDLIIASLAHEGLRADVELREGVIEGLRVPLADGTHLFITDPAGCRITRPAADHDGLLINRYTDGDFGQWRTVYNSERNDATEDVRDAVSAITAEAREAKSGTTEASCSVWVLRRWDRHDDEVTLWVSEETAKDYLARYVGGLWGNVSWREDVPDEPPLDDQETIDLFYGPQDEWDEEGYSLYAEEVNHAL